ncbi:MAG: hypothetical protein KHX37_09875 [Eubacterium sp.]|nr:hypothetical protein [Eubacterium sp.]
MCEKICINEETQGKRIDKFLGKALQDTSRSYVQKLIDDKNILVNGRECKSNYKLKLGDVISVDIPEPIFASSVL